MKFKNIIKKITKNILRPLNVVVISKDALKLKPTALVDLRNGGFNFSPLDVKKFTSINLVFFLINISTDTIRYSKLLKVWIETLQLYGVENINDKEEIFGRKSFIHFKNYYDLFCPANVAELLGVESDKIYEVNQKQYLAKHPLYAVNPWEMTTPDQKYAGNKTAIEKEFLNNGGKNYSVEDGCKFFGPSSLKMVEIEYKRLIKVYDSIKKNGYLDMVNKEDELDNYPRATIFVEENTYSIQLEGAWHRTAAMLALDFKYIPSRVANNDNDIFVKENVDNWPHVKSGLYSRKDALNLFNSPFLMKNNTM